MSDPAQGDRVAPTDPAFVSKGFIALKVLGCVWAMLIGSFSLLAAVTMLIPTCAADAKGKQHLCGSYSLLMNNWEGLTILAMYAVAVLTVPWVIMALVCAFYEHQE